jgi:hypothetical protein
MFTQNKNKTHQSNNTTLYSYMFRFGNLYKTFNILQFVKLLHFTFGEVHYFVSKVLYECLMMIQYESKHVAV